MAQLRTLKLSNGEVIEVEVSVPTGESTVTAGHAEAVLGTLNDVVGKLASFSKSLIEELRMAGPKKVEVAFGVKLGGKTGLVIAEGNGQANLSVKLSFGGEAEGSDN